MYILAPKLLAPRLYILYILPHKMYILTPKMYILAPNILVSYILSPKCTY